MSTCSILQLSSRSALRSFLFNLAPIRGRSVTSSRVAIRRATIHVVARLAVAATCTSSAAAFDAAHTIRMSVAAVGGRHSQELFRHETTPNSAQSSVTAAVEAPTLLTTGRDFLAKSQSASQRMLEFQPGEPSEMGKQ